MNTLTLAATAPTNIALLTTKAIRSTATPPVDRPNALPLGDNGVRALDGPILRHLSVIAGMRIVESELLCSVQTPLHVHRRRRNQSERYHLRVQKKWEKRWGVAYAHRAYLITDPAIGPGVIVHPDEAALLRRMVTSAASADQSAS